MTTGIGIGSTIGGYTLESVLGRGGMSVVYVAEDAKLGRRVALKIMSEELSENEAFRTRFIREAKMAANLEHPSIVPVYDAGEADDVLYLAMRVIRGTDLRREITEGGPMEAERTMAIMRQVASALDTAHRAGLVHRDVKPGNILLATGGDDEHAYLTDFGLTKHVSSKSGLTKTGTFMGTIDYVAPEQIRGTEVDGRTDLYSLGCVLYECLTGDVPFIKDTDVAILFAHLEDERPHVTSKRPELPDAMDAVVARAMSKDRDDRFPTCIAFIQAAREALMLAPSVSGSVPAATLTPTIVAQPPEDVDAPTSGVDAPERPEERLEPHPSFPPADEPSDSPAAAVELDAAMDEVSTMPPASFPPVETSPPLTAPRVQPSGAVVPAPPEIGAPAPPGPPGPKQGPDRSPESRSRILVLIGIVAVMTVLGIGAAIALSGGEEPNERATPNDTNTPTQSTTAPPTTTTPPVDVVAPVRAPIGLRETEVTSSSVALRWNAAPNGSKAVQFLVFRNGKQIEELRGTTFIDQDLDPSTKFLYRIVAVGKDGSRAGTDALPVTTLAPPSSGGGDTSGGGTETCTVADHLAGLC